MMAPTELFRISMSAVLQKQWSGILLNLGEFEACMLIISGTIGEIAVATVLF